MSSTSPKGFAFVNAEMIVVNAIGGNLTPQQVARFEADYRVIFGAEFAIPVYDDTPIYIGGSYDPDSGTFSPPPPAEPEPDPIVEETTNDDAPIE